ncbi:MAG: hypothetical protein Q8J97_03995, partial [Flavobacteriaceae bacterium]|nr:hypothetical protein [Flavobacteriaceae bacterium]
ALSQDRATQPVVARRNTMPTLMKFVQHHNSEVQLIAAQTIELLSSHPDNPEFMCREAGFLALMYNMFKETEIDNPELHDVFARIFDNLRPVLMKNAPPSQTSRGGDENTPPSGTSSGACCDGESARVSKYRSTRVLVGAAAMPSRSLKLALQDFDNSEAMRSELEELLQTVRGVISYSIDATGECATLLLTTPTPTLLKLVSDAGFCGSVAEEVEVDQGGHATDGNAFQQRAGAADGARRSFLRRASFHPTSDFLKSLVPHGVDSNSLAERLKRQKEEQLRTKKEAESSTIRSFISTLTTGWW